MNTELLKSLRQHLQNTPLEKLREEWAEVEETYHDVVRQSARVADIKRMGLIKLMEDELPNYDKLTEKEKELVFKVGLTQVDTMGESYAWKNLTVLTDDELCELYEICSDSWERETGC